MSRPIRVLFISDCCGRDCGIRDGLRHAEDQRALVEGRDPDYENMGGYAGTQYVTAAQLLASESVNNLPSQFDKAGAAKEAAITALVEDSDVKLEVAFDAPDVPEDAGLTTVEERQAMLDKAVDSKKETKVTTSKPTVAKKASVAKKTSVKRPVKATVAKPAVTASTSTAK